MEQRKTLGVLLVLSLLLLSSCMPGSIAMQQRAPAGFFMGIWHGWIAPWFRRYEGRLGRISCCGA